MVPISVNVSIADIAALDVAQVLWELVQKYQLEPKLLLVEITESMLAQNLKMVENAHSRPSTARACRADG